MADTLEEPSFVFLETTIQIDRIIGKQERRDTIRHNLQSQRLSTSGHVLNEFNKTLLRDAITFRELLLSSPDVGEAVLRLNKYDRKYGRTVGLLARLGFDNSKQNTLARLEEFIEWRAHDHFWNSIEQSDCTDKVGCMPKNWTPEQNENGDYDISRLKCLKASPPPCKVLEFIREKESLIADFVAGTQSCSRENVHKAGQALDHILKDLDSPYGERSNCYLIADTMIVLESRIDSKMYSKDRDVQEICEILGRLSYTEVPISPI